MLKVNRMKVVESEIPLEVLYNPKIEEIKGEDRKS